MKHLLFVYGKLRRGGRLSMSMNFPDARFLADAKVAGALYDLGPYPGLLLNDSNAAVIGEVYEVGDDTLSKLDEIEASSEYWRREIEITLTDQHRKCWIYLPEHDAEFYADQILITSGDWIEYSNNESK